MCSFPIPDIKRTLDAMSWVKLNEFHWHITDSQYFPLQLPGFESLASSSAYSPSSIYSAHDVAAIIAYAGARGIDVLLEIDTPGHTTSIGAAFPEFVACMDASPWATYANEPPAGQLRLTQGAVLNFTTSLFEALLDVVEGPYVSTGGDEVNLPCYEDDSVTQEALNASGQTFGEALNAFVGATHQVLANAGKTPAVWEGK